MPVDFAQASTPQPDTFRRGQEAIVMNARFKNGHPVRFIRRIAGTSCWLVGTRDNGWRYHAYVLESEVVTAFA